MFWLGVSGNSRHASSFPDERPRPRCAKTHQRIKFALHDRCPVFALEASILVIQEEKLSALVGGVEDHSLCLQDFLGADIAFDANRFFHEPRRIARRTDGASMNRAARTPLPLERFEKRTREIPSLVPLKNSVEILEEVVGQHAEVNRWLRIENFWMEYCDAPERPQIMRHSPRGILRAVYPAIGTHEEKRLPEHYGVGIPVRVLIVGFREHNASCLRIDLHRIDESCREHPREIRIELTRVSVDHA